MNSRFWFSLSVIGLFTVLFLPSCSKTEPYKSTNQYLVIPKGFPDIDFPNDNAFSNERWELGKKLFFDPVLSKDSSISCATCHKPEFAFADNQSTTPGIYNRPGNRNVPSLANVAYFPYFIREGSVSTLEMQVLVPIQEHNEFNSNIVDLSEKLNTIPEYVKLSNTAYDRNPDPFVITRAIATFERSILSGNSIYDDYLDGNEMALNSSELEGMKLFNSARTNCTSCHSGLLFTNHAFENNGLYQNYPDSGRMRFTNLESDRALFKVPSLRNIGVTGPYMYDGSLLTLEDVINHYNEGGNAHPNKNAQITPLYLSEEEKRSLLAFLNSLTDFRFINDYKWN
ncbi:MAG: cytochrome c peroxidase [Salibacteraceae bacterium]|jgi:cytochrome c peroxidase